MAVALALLDAGGVTSSRRARSGKLGTPNRQERGARSARMGILAGVGDQGNTFDISIGALSGVVQHDNGPSKRHNATQQRDNGKTPERGAEKATTPTKSDVAVTRQFIRTEICCYKGKASIPGSHPNIPSQIFKHNVELTVVDDDPSTTQNA
ncbi:hypothetical protein C8R43DRAFT_950103 [Mycena crocata]|nr:hypothetical protein C8R43DRAFT_950103 [Mycena crocata]